MRTGLLIKLNWQQGFEIFCHIIDHTNQGNS
jgi:hypothetical protein